MVSSVSLRRLFLSSFVFLFTLLTVASLFHPTTAGKKHLLSESEQKCKDREDEIFNRLFAAVFSKTPPATVEAEDAECVTLMIKKKRWAVASQWKHLINFKKLPALVLPGTLEKRLASFETESAKLNKHQEDKEMASIAAVFAFFAAFEKMIVTHSNRMATALKVFENSISSPGLQEWMKKVVSAAPTVSPVQQVTFVQDLQELEHPLSHSPGVEAALSQCAQKQVAIFLSLNERRIEEHDFEEAKLVYPVDRRRNSENVHLE